MAGEPHAPLPSLQDIAARIEQELALAVRDKSHGWRLAVLASVEDGLPDARTVVLREYDRERRCLLIFSDARSAKVRQVRQQERGMLVLWSAALGWQLRLQVNLQVQTSGLALSSRWARLKLSPAAQDYLSPLPPGTPLRPESDAEPGAVSGAVSGVVSTDLPPAAPEPDRESRQHFAMLEASVLSTDWLELHARGHRRARFDSEGARWLTP